MTDTPSDPDEAAAGSPADGDRPPPGGPTDPPPEARSSSSTSGAQPDGPTAGTQQVRFVGGIVGGMIDGVQEIAPGLLPADLECWGSVYRLTDPGRGQPLQYRFVRPARADEITIKGPAQDPTEGGAPGHAAELRDQAGRQRDVAAHTRDVAAEQRDQLAERRDQEADLSHHRIVGFDPPAPDTGSTAAADREHSRVDRRAGAVDRVAAAHDRSSASADRSAAAADRWHGSVDPLTGVHTREAGLLELDRDLARVVRTGHRLVLAFIDVDHLKVINDEGGHAAGDRLLKLVADTLQAALRPYDLVVRYGGDEFLCAVQGIDLATARPRFARINVMLGRSPSQGSVTVGLAQWQAGETAQSLIARADADLYRQRQLHRP